MLTVAKIIARLAFACIALKLVADVRGVGRLDCPLCNVAECENDTTVQERCPDVGLVADACGCCKVCGKKFGEVCGGAYAYLGTCEYDEKKKIFCTANRTEYLQGVNVSGICTRKSCLKNCSTQPLERVCGTDGRWYRNKCALRQNKYCNGTGISVASRYVCDRACVELQAPKRGNVSFTKGIAQTSVATFACHPPYTLQGNVNRTCGERGGTASWDGSQPACKSPCDLHTCVKPTVCTLDADNQPQCVCESVTQCAQENDPVCASDGRTYRSECHMRAQTCQTCSPDSSSCNGVAVYVLSSGKCPPESTSQRDSTGR